MKRGPRANWLSRQRRGPNHVDFNYVGSTPLFHYSLSTPEDGAVWEVQIPNTPGPDGLVEDPHHFGALIGGRSRVEYVNGTWELSDFSCVPVDTGQKFKHLPNQLCRSTALQDLQYLVVRHVDMAKSLLFDDYRQTGGQMTLTAPPGKTAYALVVRGALTVPSQGEVVTFMESLEFTGSLRAVAQGDTIVLVIWER